MRNLFLALALLTSIKATYGQVGNENINHKDSIALSKTWEGFKRKLFLKDINSLKSISCKQVFGNCILKPISENCQPYGSSNRLFTLFYREMFPQNRSIILTDKYKIVVYSSIKDGTMNVKHPTQFQIWFTNNSKPGSQFAFVFERIKGKFKFSGLDAIP